MQIIGITKGDTVNFECQIDLDSGQDISNWKIRCEIYDNCSNSIKLATANSGGSNSQIEVTDGLAGEFTIKISKASTKNFENKSFIEIEVENEDEEVFTPVAGEENQIIFTPQRITWVTP